MSETEGSILCRVEGFFYQATSPCPVRHHTTLCPVQHKHTEGVQKTRHLHTGTSQSIAMIATRSDQPYFPGFIFSPPPNFSGANVSLEIDVGRCMC